MKMKRMLIYLRFVFLCTFIVASVVSCSKDDDSESPTIKPILAVELNIENDGGVVKVGEVLKLEYTIIPFNATMNKDIIWQSSDEKIATVKDGVITAVSKGEVTIKGSFKNGISSKVHIMVKPLPYVIDPAMVGTWKCVKLQARYLRTGEIFEEDEMDRLFNMPKDKTMAEWCQGYKDSFNVKSTKDNKIIWPIKLNSGDMFDVVGDLTRNEDMDNLFFINYHLSEIGFNFGKRTPSYDAIKVIWLPKTKQVIYDDPDGSFYDFIYTCEIIKEKK
jgi:hypothetical protein